MKNALTWGTSLINLDISGKRHPNISPLDVVQSQVESITYRVCFKKKKEVNLNLIKPPYLRTVSTGTRGNVFNESTRVKDAIGQTQIMGHLMGQITSSFPKLQEERREEEKEKLP